MKYVEKFSKMTQKQTIDLIDSLKEISFLKENKELLYQIVYALPTNIDQVKLFLPKDAEINEEELNLILAQTKKFGEKL
jgi:DNA-directed RNA polymerase subunit F